MNYSEINALITIIFYMKKLDIYIIRQFISTLSMTLMGFVSVILVVDLIENLDRFIDNSVPAGVTLKYYIYAIPWFINLGLPMSMLISTVFTVGVLAKRNELTAMKSNGISLYRIAVPITTIGFIVSLVSFELDNRWVVKGNKVRYDIERQYMKRKARVKTQKEIRNIFLQKNEMNHISLAKFRPETNSGNNITFISLDDGIVTKRMDGKTVKWIDSLKVWSVKNYSIRDFDINGSVKNTIISKNDTIIELNFSPEDITQQSKKPDEMSFGDLTARIKQLKENGVDSTKWEVDRYFKISFAFTNFIIVLFGIPLVVVRPKGGLSFGAGMGIFVIFIYYVFIKLGMSIGYSGITSPIVAAWMGNVLFFIGGILLLVFVRKWIFYFWIINIRRTFWNG